MQKVSLDIILELDPFVINSQDLNIAGAFGCMWFTGIKKSATIGFKLPDGWERVLENSPCSIGG